MANSAFWRDLADQFLALQDRLRPASGADDLIYKSLEVLAKRGASEIAGASAPDLLTVWIEALRKEGLAFQSSNQSNEVLSADDYAQKITMGTIDGICQASATFCKRLEDQAVQAEFEEQGRSASPRPAPAPAPASAPVPQEPKATQVAPAQPEEANAQMRSQPESQSPKRAKNEVLGSTAKRKVVVPARTLEKTKDTILSLATAAVSGTLLKEVTEVLKRLFRILYDSPEEIGQAPEWQELDKLFCTAGDTYVSVAMGNRRKIRGDLFGWVKEKIEADADAISIQHFMCDRNGYLASKGTLADHLDTWRAMAHYGFMPLNAVSSVFRKNLARAESVALGNAAIRIASVGTSFLQHVNQDSASGVGLQARLLSIRSSAPPSTFEATVGKLMVETRRACPTKYLPKAEILKIAALLDDKNVPVRSNLERDAARTMAEYNQKHPTAAIKSWKTALGHPQFQRAVRKRFSRAEEKYKKATQSVVARSAGTPRTTI